MRHRSNYTISHKPIRGFTLIELLVVVSIIALLVSILMPALGRARNHTRKVMCMSNMKQVTLGIMCYAVDYNNYVPDGYRYPEGAYHLTDYGLWDMYNGWIGIGKLYDLEYVSNYKVFYCPATQTIARSGTFNMEYEWASLDVGVHIRGNMLHRGAFDWKLDSPEMAPATHLANTTASYAFAPGRRLYALLACYTVLEEFTDTPTGHLLLGGRPGAFSDGGVSWVLLSDVPTTNFGFQWRDFDLQR